MAKARREGKRYGMEIRVPNGICDFVTTKVVSANHNIPWVTCYEIKVSFSDYQYSENGANFLGDENYYVFPEELLEEIISKEAQGKLQGVGVYTYKAGRFRKRTDGKAFRPKLSMDDRFLLMDRMIGYSLYHS